MKWIKYKKYILNKMKLLEQLKSHLINVYVHNYIIVFITSIGFNIFDEKLFDKI